ncbi:MAG: hypothetical protein HC930_17790 [Hydrococcus sp. SU_1_0]|nr:hypothetical protein [Hydrococcus sp. SU_1_0]
MSQVSKPSEPRSLSKFPLTIVAVSREEFIDPIELTIRDAKGNQAILPNDLQGHYFLISPAGLPDSAKIAGNEQVVWTTKDGWTPIYNGDGIVYRFSFGNGGCTLKTRLVKPPCYYADLAASNQADLYGDLALKLRNFPSFARKIRDSQSVEYKFCPL